MREPRAIEDLRTKQVQTAASRGSDDEGSTIPWLAAIAAAAVSRTISLSLATVLAAGLASPVAYAKTPDGETPANEGVCDELISFTPGLYGLCVAFCEAQDCEATFDPGTGEVIFDPSCSPSNPKLLANYNKRKTLTDLPMPCINIVEGECPCWTPPELDAIGDGTTNFCLDDNLVSAQISGPDAATGLSDGAFVDYGGFIFGEPACFYFEHSPPANRFLLIPQEQADACRAEINTECAARGF